MPRIIKKESGQTREDFRIQLDNIFRNFLDTDELSYNFPCTLDSVQRKYIHSKAQRLGLSSKSHGKEPNRSLRISKKCVNDKTEMFTMELSLQSRASINKLICNYPTHNLQQMETAFTQRKQEPFCDKQKSGRLSDVPPSVPPQNCNPALQSFRNALPITVMKNEVLQNIISKPVTIICSETGSGKTTQIPQYILEHSHQHNLMCRVICTQPRRLSAVSVAHRVAEERKEAIGLTVGYQIRLESCTSMKTCLLYCTNGVLLRTLMAGDLCLQNITHIIIDEIHERDQFSDFLLISLRECLLNYKHLRLILMSATMNVELFERYFQSLDVGIVMVPGRQHAVEEFYLEDILQFTNYCNERMLPIGYWNNDPTNGEDVNGESVMNNAVHSNSIGGVGVGGGGGGGGRQQPMMMMFQDNGYSNGGAISEGVQLELQNWLVECIEHGTEDSFSQILQLILSENVPVNYQHPVNGYCALIAAAIHGNLDITEQLLTMGANTELMTGDGRTAYDWAMYYKKEDVAELLRVWAIHNSQNLVHHQGNQSSSSPRSESVSDSCHSTSASSYASSGGGAIVAPPFGKNDTSSILNVYDSQTMEEFIDFDLLIEILIHIMKNTAHGGILVFLPGYDDILTAQQRIYGEPKLDYDFEMYMLHSSMDVKEQQRVFERIDKRKIILSTNIAETSVTINDVVHVVDSGKVKEKSYDAMNNVCTLKSNWISQACAKQRAGRAGRTQPGTCYHMFSTQRYRSMQRFSTPEILRLPLRELCLQTKKLAPPTISIAEFLSRAVEAPSQLAIQKSVESLIELGALDRNETLTKLGNHLLQLSVDPHLGKMLLYAVVFKCVDPVLTVVSCLSQKDPFVLPMQPQLKQEAFNMKKHLGSESFSDHMTMLKAFQFWQDARSSGTEVEFCNQYYVSSATMEMVVGFRSQLLGQLRAMGFVRHKPPDTIKDLNCHSDCWPLIKMALAAGLYPNMAYIDKANLQLRTQREKKIIFHMSSILRNSDKRAKSSAKNSQLESFPSNWVLFEELSRIGLLCSIKCVTLVNPLTMSLVSPNYEQPKDDDWYEVNDWINFQCDDGDARLIHQFKLCIAHIVNKKIRNPDVPYNQMDELILKTLREVLKSEDDNAGFADQVGTGKQPKPFIMEAKRSNFRSMGGGGGGNRLRQANGGSGGKPMKPKMYAHAPVDAVHAPSLVALPEQLRNLNLQQKGGGNGGLGADSVVPSCIPNSQPLHSSMHRNGPSTYYLNGNGSSNGNYSARHQNGYGAGSGYHHQHYRSAGGFTNRGAAGGNNCDRSSSSHSSASSTASTSTVNNYMSSIPFALPPNTVVYNIVTTKNKLITQSVSTKTWIFKREAFNNLMRYVQEKKSVLLVFSLVNPYSSSFCGLAQFLGTPDLRSLICPINWLRNSNISHIDVLKQLLPNQQCVSVDLSEERVLDDRLANVIYSMYQNMSGIGRPILGGH